MPLITVPKSIDGMNTSEKSILNKLKLLYSAQANLSYLYLEPKIKNLSPDFILIDPLRGVIIIEVKAWGIDYIDSINNKEVLSSKGDRLENPLAKARRYFNTIQGVFRFYNTLFDEQNKLKVKLHSVIVFTEMLESEAKENKIESFFEHYPARVIYKNHLNNLDLGSLFNMQTEAIQEDLVDILRVAIFPEIKVANRIGNKSNRLTDEKILALDVEQERFAKSLPLGHYIITGIPGSGKTVALLSRAVYLAKVHPEWNILILTYNKALKSQLNAKIDKIKMDLNTLDISIDNIEISTFHQKAMSLSRLYPQNFKDKESFWRDDLPNDALNYAQATYHAILVDEYQDFYKNWFQLVLKLLIVQKEEDKSYYNLFLAGDRLQSIYNPNEINWKQDIGLDMRGRAKLLKTSYRITKEHIDFGLALLINDSKYKKEVENFYEEGKHILLKNRSKHSIEIIESDYKGIADKFINLLKEYEYKDIMLLAPSWYKIKVIKESLSYEIQQNIVSNKEDNAIDKSIFTTYHSSKGIEAKVAIVVDIHLMKERKLLYVASTRASSKLILHLSKQSKNNFIDEVLNLVSSSCGE